MSVLNVNVFSGRNEVSPRFLRHLNILSIDRFRDETLRYNAMSFLCYACTLVLYGIHLEYCCIRISPKIGAYSRRNWAGISKLDTR